MDSGKLVAGQRWSTSTYQALSLAEAQTMCPISQTQHQASQISMCQSMEKTNNY